MKAAAELDALPAEAALHSMMSDYADLRAQARACRSTVALKP